MPIIAIGLNHKSAPVQVREKLAFSAGQTALLLERLRGAHGGEHLLLSTCNRSELYHVGGADKQSLIASLGEQAGTEVRGLEDYFYCHHDREAVHHLFNVAAGLDSMVVGEYEILKQVKDALAAANDAHSVGPILSRLFHEALAAGKRVRRETEISRGVFSVGGCAVTLAKTIFGELSGAQVAIVGAGEMAEAVARALISSGAKSVFVANRTYYRACQLAAQLNGEAVLFEDLAEIMAKCCVLVSSTAAPHPIITREMVADVMRARRNRPLFLIDIAVPRDIEEAVGTVDNVYLYNIDDLNGVVERDSQARLKEAAKVERIIHEHAEQFFRWHASRAALPTMKALQEKFHAIRAQELQEALRRLPELSPAEREKLEQFSHAIINKILHLPMTQLRNGAGEQEEIVESLRRIFGLDEEVKK